MTRQHVWAVSHLINLLCQSVSPGSSASHTCQCTPGNNKWKKNWDSNICFVFLLVLHKNKIEGAVEDCVDKVRGGQIEDEEVGHGPHLPVIWTKTVRMCSTMCRQFLHRCNIVFTIFGEDCYKDLLFIESAYIY